MVEVRNIISEIGQKVSRLKNDLSQVRSENTMLNETIENLKDRLLQRDLEIQGFKLKLDELKQKENQFLDTNMNDTKNDEIDALVREIDTCITQLKENNNG